jgi:trigger factor
MSSVAVKNGTGKLARKLEITYKSNACKAAYDKKLKELSKTIQLKGFRPGHVPVKAIKRQYGSQILQEILEKEIPEMVQKQFEKDKINPIFIPQMDMAEIASEQDMDEDVVINLDFEVFPEVKLVSLKEESIKNPVVKVIDSDLKETLERMQQMHITWKPVERAAKNKDQVTIDFEGLKDGVAFEGGTAKGQNLVLGEKKFIPGFEEGVVGLKKGDKKDLDLTFPKDYGSKDLAGQKVLFKINVNDVSEGELPKLDDEFAKKFDIKTIEALKKEVKQNLEHQSKNKILEVKKTRAADLLIKLIPVDMSQYLVDQEIEHMKRQMFAQYQGIGEEHLNALIAQQDTTKEMLDEAHKRIKTGLIFNEIANKNNIKAKPADLEKFISDMANMYDNPAKARAELMKDQNALTNAHQMVLENEIVSYVYKEAKSTDEDMEFKKLLVEK